MFVKKHRPGSPSSSLRTDAEHRVQRGYASGLAYQASRGQEVHY
jgi:hypothetical protein